MDVEAEEINLENQENSNSNASKKKKTRKYDQPWYRTTTWCYTFQLDDEEQGWDSQNIQNIEAVLKTVPSKYHVFGRETAPTTGKKHLQGLIIFPERTYFKLAVKKLTVNEKKPHICAQGFSETHKRIPSTVQDAIQYCKKEGNFWENGIPPNAWLSSGDQKFDEALTLAETGNLKEIRSKYPRLYTTYKNFYIAEANKNAKYEMLTGNIKEHFLWLYGPSGVGKSYLARKLAADSGRPYYVKALNKWWDNYENEDIVIIEEINPDYCSKNAAEIKTWFDIYPFPCEFKGGSFKQIRPQYMIITSNYSVEECFSFTDIDPIKRRFTAINYLVRASVDQPFPWSIPIN